MPSNVIRRFAYDSDRQELWIEFVSGRRYIYSLVPEEIAATLGSTFSKGIYFNSRIRDAFPCREAPHHQEATES